MNKLTRLMSPIIILFTLVTTLAIAGQLLWAIREDLSLTLAAEQRNGLVAVRLLEQHAAQELQMAERRLESISIGALALSGKGQPLDGPIRDLIANSVETSRTAASLQFVNNDGERWVSISDFPLYSSPTEFRDYIDDLLAHPNFKRIIIGRPVRRSIDDVLILPVARNLYDRDGVRIGLISTDLSVSDFADTYENVAKTSEAEIDLLAENGRVLVHSPSKPEVREQSDTSIGLHEIARKGPIEGSFERSTHPDGSGRRMIVYRKNDKYGVTTIFSRNSNSVLSAWTSRSRDRLIYSGIFIALQLSLSYFLLVHIRRLHRSRGLLRKSENSLRESEAKFINLFERSPVPLALISLVTDQLMEANEAFLQQFAYARESFLGRTPLELKLWEDADAREDYLRKLSMDRYVDGYEACLADSAGRQIICMLSSRIVAFGSEQVCIFSPINVTQQRAVEAEIREVNAFLEQRVQERTHVLEVSLASVKAMQNELVRAEKMAALGSLVAGVAHELNTPIGNALTAASTIQDCAESLLIELSSERPRRSVLKANGEALKHGSDIVVRNLHRAATLICSFKQVAVDQSSDQRRNFDLKCTIKEIWNTLAPMCRVGAHALELDFDTDIRLDSYPGAFAQIVTHFVSNSITHGFDGRHHGLMTIKARTVNSGDIRISFSDDGHGIETNVLKKVFDPFFTTQLGSSGGGLGMSIVHNLVTGPLGGRIAVESELGFGTIIHIDLPVCAPG